MPPGFGLLDTTLVSIPIFLMLLGLIRGAPVELASCLGCLAGVVAAWMVSALPFVHALGQPAAPLLAVLAGIVVWRLARGLSKRLGFDTRWIDLGRIFDSVVGGAMGAVRGLALVSAACLCYAMIAVPLGLANPMRTVAYPVFLAAGSQVTSAVIESTEPLAAKFAASDPVQSLATVPLPFTPMHVGTPEPAPAPLPAAATRPQPLPLPLPAAVPVQTANGPGLATLLHVIAPSAVAAPARPIAVPVPVYHPDIPVRGIPVGLMETHHNILHPFGAGRRAAHR